MTQQLFEADRSTISLDRVTVADAMHPGVVTCPLETPLATVAWMMAVYRIHSVVVFRDDLESQELWGVVSDLDLVAASSAGELEDRTAGGTAVTPVVLVKPEDTLAHAAQLMSEHEITHLVVLGAELPHPIGILSTLDVARVLGGVRP
jgi:CBS domain-containing protein